MGVQVSVKTETDLIPDADQLAGKEINNIRIAIDTNTEALSNLPTGGTLLFDDSEYAKITDTLLLQQVLLKGAPSVLLAGTLAGGRSKDFIVKDSSNKVRQWPGILGINDLAQKNPALMPTWGFGGIEFNNSRMSVIFPLTQPVFYYLLMKPMTDVPGPYICGTGGGGNNVLYGQNFDSTPQLVMESAGQPIVGNIVPDAWNLVKAFYNGANSKLTIGDTTVTGTVGTNPSNGVTLGSNLNVDGGSFGHVFFEEYYIRNTDAGEDEITAYLQAKLIELNG